MIPRAIGLGGSQIVFLVITSLASLLPPGAITAFTFAFAVLQIPIGVIGVPLGVVLLPSMSREAAQGDTEAFRRLLVRGLRLIAYVMVVLASLGIVAAHDLTRLLFDYGKISDDTIDSTGLALAAFLLGLTAHALIAVLARAFYARQDTATPVVASLVAVGVDVGLALVLVGPLGLTGLALAVAIGAWVETGVLAVLLRRAVPGLGLGEVVRILLLTAGIGALGAVVAFAMRQLLVEAWGEDPVQILVLARAAASVIVGGIVILLASRALRIAELPTIVGVVVDLLRRRGRS
jgi:putative peptidoglycan lipid II flippase